MRILILSNNSSGLFNFRKEVVTSLLENGHEVTIATPFDHRVEYFTAIGCRYVEIDFDRRGVNPVADLKLLFKYLKLIRKETPDAILTYTVKPNVYGGMAATLLSVPYIANITGLGAGIEERESLRKIVTMLYKIGLSKANTVFLQNQENLEFLEKHGIAKGKLRLIPGSGVNLEEFTFSEEMPDSKLTIFAFIGRIMRTRGIEEFLAAAEALKEEGASVKFLIFGAFDGDYGDKIQDLHNREIVEYKGVSTNIKEDLLGVHAVVVPSYYEGMSNSLLEAGARGRGLIGTDISGIREIIDDGVTGYLCKPYDARSLTDAMRKFVSLTKAERKLMALDARRKIESEFDRNIVVNSYLGAVDNC